MIRAGWLRGRLRSAWLPSLRSAALPLLALSCGTAAPQQVATAPRTIEPPAAGPVGQGSAGESEFVISRSKTAGSSAGHSADDQPEPHLADDWWRFRADFLRTNIPQVRERDAAFSERQPPPVFWDQQTALEASAVWGALCNECHGGRRRVEDAIKMPPPPAGWGRGEGLFFGVRRPYEVLFNIVYNGGPERNGKRSEMPAWRNRLAKEQIWAILYFLEYQSGGIEGRFPPSLYPRMREGH
jgi:mono/diheme cytochrome c family protein